MLPVSFSINSMEQMVQFLNESNKIEDIAIDYGNKKHQTMEAGHFGALVLSQKQALEKKPLSVRMIKDWQALVTSEQRSAGVEIDDEAIGHIRSYSLPRNVYVGGHTPPSYAVVPDFLAKLIEEINEGLRDQEKLKDDEEFAKFLGYSFQQFESIHPFVDGNGRVGRLLANYILTYYGRKIIVFQSSDKEKSDYYKAHKSPDDMALFMAIKIKETISEMKKKEKEGVKKEEEKWNSKAKRKKI